MKYTRLSLLFRMKTPAEYLAGQAFEARRPRRELQPVVTLAAAEQAIAQALADADKYRYLLLRALRHAADDYRPASATDTPVIPLYPQGLPDAPAAMAA